MLFSRTFFIEPYLAKRTLKSGFIFIFLLKTTIIFVAPLNCVIAHKSVCSRIILNMKRFKIVRWSIKFEKTPHLHYINSIWVKITFHIMSIKSSLNVWTDFDKRWINYLIILGKVDWLNGQHSLWSLRFKFFHCVYRDFVWFHHRKNQSSNCPANTIHGTFTFMKGLVIVPLKVVLTYVNANKCVKANMYLEQNYWPKYTLWISSCWLLLQFSLQSTWISASPVFNKSFCLS